MKLKLYRDYKAKELQEFVNSIDIGEDFDYDAPFIFYYKLGGKLVFVNVFRLDIVDDTILPRFIHILIDPSIRRSKLIVDLLNQAEQYLNLLGYTNAFAYILKSNTVMSKLAKKFGYKPGREDNQAIYYFKNINNQLSKEKVNV